MNPIRLSCLKPDPLQPGRWWIVLPHGESVPEWIDALAHGAQASWPGKVAVLDAAATLISNLRVWENIVLPRWHHENLRLSAFEEVLADVCDQAGLSAAQREKLVARLPAMLDRGERRLVVLLRAVMTAPDCVIVEEDVWRDLSGREEDSPHARLWRCLQACGCFVVCGHAPAQAGFSPVLVQEQEGEG